MDEVALASLRAQAASLKLNGLLAHWGEATARPEGVGFVGQMLAWEQAERGTRSLLRRERSARIGRFKSIAYFDWDWPSSIDRGAVMDLMSLSFIKDASNVVIVGPKMLLPVFVHAEVEQVAGEVYLDQVGHARFLDRVIQLGLGAGV